MNEQILEKLRSMKLRGFIEAYTEQTNAVEYHDMSFEDRLALLVENEYLRRMNARFNRAYSCATLPVGASVASVDFQQNRGFSKSDVLEFANCFWIKNFQNIILTGATGCGKTYLACALADSALKARFKVKYYKTHELLALYSIACEQGNLSKFIQQINKFELVIFDEWLRDNFQLEQSRFILDLIDSRYRSRSIIFISQLPIEKWHSRLGEPTIADAILDRIIHESFKLTLKGESMRKNTSSLISRLAS